MGSIVVGVGGLAAGLLPYPVSLVGAALGAAALAAGIVGLVRQDRQSPALATIGVLVATVAVVTGLAMSYPATPSTAPDPPASETTRTDRPPLEVGLRGSNDTDTVLADELHVSIGDYGPGPHGDDVLPVPLTNRLDVQSTFILRVSAFEGGPDR